MAQKSVGTRFSLITGFKAILAAAFSVWLLGLQSALHLYAGALLGTVLGIVLVYFHYQLPFKKIKHRFFAQSKT